MRRDPKYAYEEWSALKKIVWNASEPLLRRTADGLDSLLRRWPWLYRKLGGD